MHRFLARFWMGCSMKHAGGRQPYHTGGMATAEQGLVLLDGPDGVAVAMTPDAADATAQSLAQAAIEARAQANSSPAPSPAK